MVSVHSPWSLLWVESISLFFILPLDDVISCHIVLCYNETQIYFTLPYGIPNLTDITIHLEFVTHEKHITLLTVYHYSDVIMGAMAFQITSLAFVYSSVYSGVDQRKHQSSASLAFVRGIPRWPGNSPHKSPVNRKMLQFDDVIMTLTISFGRLWLITHSTTYHIR